MKDDEIKFFRTCWNLKNSDISIREIINVVCEFIPYKRCWWLLKKWGRLDFYDYGVALDLGWFVVDKLPERYKALVKEE